MPLYDFICPSCDYSRTDVLVLNRDAIVTCLVCGGGMDRRLFTKGAAFVVTGYNAKNGYCGGGKVTEVKMPQNKDVRISVTHS